MTDETIPSLFLQKEGYAIFEYLGHGIIRPIGRVAAWCGEIFGEKMAVGGSFQIEGKVPFLENFLLDAEEVWNSESENRVNSGSWIEKGVGGRELALEASALRIAGKRILIIQNPQARYDEEHQWLQKARDWLLAHERLQKEIQKKEILLHCIIHDLSQPLTAMRSCFYLLGQQQLSPELKEVVGIAARQSEKQETMIRGILEAFSAELAAQQVFEKDRENAPDLVRCAQKTVEAFRGAFLERGARIELDARLDLSRDYRVMGDESHLLRILGNLGENALRYSPAGGAVTLGVIDEDRFLRGFVDDEGPGLPKDEAATDLFALFAKGKGDRAGKSGLGLYFCKITVERWGGTIGCESRPGGGARFWFRLPRF